MEGVVLYSFVQQGEQLELIGLGRVAVHSFLRVVLKEIGFAF